MGSLLTDADKASFKSSIEDLFDTFARDIVIHKEPKKIVSQINPSNPPMPIPRGTVAIKVQEDARNYINKGITEKIDLDDKSFKVATSDSVKDHFGYQLFVYFLEEIK